MISSMRGAASRVLGHRGLTVVILFALAFAVPASADVDLRVEARPVDQPIQAFVTVTSSAGVPVPGLTAADFTVRIDSQLITLQGPDVTLPPAQDATQKLSVVFVMDYSQSVVAVARTEMQDAVIDFIAAMNDGDQAAVVKFNFENPLGASLVAPFTEIDAVLGNQPLVDAVLSDYPGDGTNLLDAVEVALNHMLNPPATLPDGPKAIILISDGAENSSLIEASDVFQLANANSIPIFTIGIGDLTIPGSEQLMRDLGFLTGGDFFEAPSPTEISDAYASISTRLNNEYLITIPSGIGDCATHEFELTVTGNAPVTVMFTRRICDTVPDPFSFTSQIDAEPDVVVISNPQTITGIEVPAQISVTAGGYSIGCDGTFTQAAGTISNGQVVCVDQRTSSAFSTTRNAILTIGGVASAFSTTTRARSSGGGGGGGGATGLLELLFGLGALLLGRRYTA